MSGTASNLYMNWTGVTIAPPSPAALITVGEVTDIKVDNRSAFEVFFGDNRKFARKVRQHSFQRSITIVGGNAWILQSIPEGVPCTVTAILNDADNGVGAGAITFTLVGGKCVDKPTGGSNNKFATGSATFIAEANDADDEPLTMVKAT